MLNSNIFDAIGIDPALIIAILTLLVLILLITVLVLIVKVNHLMKRYDLFMRGKDCETMEDNIVEIYRKLQVMQNKDLANKDIMKMMNRNMVNTIQKTGLVKYNAFEGMGGQSSFAFTLLNMENTGYILNAMHSRNSCYVYIKEVRNGEPEVPLSQEEKMSLEQAMDKRENKRERSTKRKS